MIIDRANVSRTALRDRVIVVMGAGQGIGKETARILAHLGACVVIAELNDSGRETEQVVRAEGGQALFVRTDVSDPISMQQLHRQVAESFGPVNMLVNNAEANRTSHSSTTRSKSGTKSLR
jgi:NAD(P)-dependent dehydrogenase (short-subunit alcohol dehydrogenase family)